LSRGVVGQDFSNLVGDVVRNFVGILVTLGRRPYERFQGCVNNVVDYDTYGRLDLLDTLVTGGDLELLLLLLAVVLDVVLVVIWLVLVGEHPGLVWVVGSTALALGLFVGNLFLGLGLDLALLLVLSVGGLEGVASNQERSG